MNDLDEFLDVIGTEVREHVVRFCDACGDSVVPPYHHWRYFSGVTWHKDAAPLCCKCAQNIHHWYLPPHPCMCKWWAARVMLPEGHR